MAAHLALFLLLCCCALGGRGLDLAGSAPPEGATARLEVEVWDHDLQDTLAAGAELGFEVVPDQGRAVVVSAEPLAEDGAGVVTVLAVDQSGSFRVYRDQAWSLAEAYVRGRLPGERIGILLFGLAAEEFPTEVDEQAILGHLQAARSRPARQAETRLGEFVRQAAARVAREQPPSAGGIRQVVLFTDGDEESSTWSVDEVAAAVRELDVRVHVVAFYRSTRGSLASRLDDMSRLASVSRGVYVQVDDPERARGELLEIRRRARHLYAIEAELCGLGADTDHLHVELHHGGSRVGWTDSVPFQASAAQRRPCEQPVATEEHLPAAGPKVRTSWACICGAVALALAVLGLVAVSLASGLQRERDEEDDVVVPPPEPPPAAPVTTPPPQDPSPSPTPTPELPRELPETHLIVASGEGLVGRRWRFTGRILRIGAAADNDVVVELPQVSGQHAQFELFVSGDVYVSDLGSTNGTWHQGDRLPSGGRVQVRPGDRVALSRQLVLELVQPGREDQA